MDGRERRLTLRQRRVTLRPTHGVPPGFLADLRHAYALPPRTYHTFAHAGDVVRRVRGLGGDRPVVLAAWAHDVVYEPGADDNEERSARWLEQRLPQDPDVAEAARLVRMTANHDPAEGDRRAAILSDADMAILAAAPARYRDYVAAVRAEHAGVSEAAWRRGRGAFLADVLSRPRIFATPEGWTCWEQAARTNIARERSVLTAG